MSEPVYVLALAPFRGDGYLTRADVAAAVGDLPHGARVDVRVVDCDDFEPGAPQALARRLVGSEVEHHFERATRIAPAWLASYDAAAAEYLAAELRRLA